MKKAIQRIKRRVGKIRPRDSQSSESEAPLMAKPQCDAEDSSITDTHNSILERLPRELLLSITDHLDDLSKTCLKYTSRSFRSMIRVDVANVDRCTHWLIMTRLEQDAMRNVRQWKNVKRMACSSCKIKKNIVDFSGDDASQKAAIWKEAPKFKYVFRLLFSLRYHQPAAAVRRQSIAKTSSDPVFDPRRWQNFPISRLCAYHNPPMTWVNDSSPRRWTWHYALYCRHCDTEITSEDYRSTGCNSCECTVCPRAPGVHFTRFGRSRYGRGEPRVDGIIYDRKDRVRLLECGIWPKTFNPTYLYPEHWELGLLLDNAFTHASTHGAFWQLLFTRLAERHECDSTCSLPSPTECPGVWPNPPEDSG